MAIQTTIAVPSTLVRSLDTGTFIQTYKAAFPVTANADSQVIATQRHAGRIFSAHMRVPANLGAGATLQLVKRDVDTGTTTPITTASAPATAGVSSSTGLVPIDFKAGDTFEVVVAGAATTTVAGIEVDVLMQRA